MDSLESIKNDIKEMYINDQKSWISGTNNDKLIKKQTTRIKDIIGIYGCIDITRFSQDTSHYAWLLVQHSNHDIPFQEKYLTLMIKSGDVLKRDIAYLTDRILILKKKPQIYGTQFNPETLDGDYSPFPIENEETVDKRRQEMGLEPMAVHKKRMWEKYKLL